MSPVDRTGPVSEVSPHSYFLCKILMCSYEKAGQPGYRDLGLISATGMKFFPNEHSSPVTGKKRF